MLGFGEDQEEGEKKSREKKSDMGESAFQILAVIFAAAAGLLALFSLRRPQLRWASALLLVGVGLFAAIAAVQMLRSDQDPKLAILASAGGLLLALVIAATHRRRRTEATRAAPQPGPEKRYKCRFCGYQLDRRHFWCRSCGAPNSFVRNPAFEPSGGRGGSKLLGRLMVGAVLLGALGYGYLAATGQLP